MTHHLMHYKKEGKVLIIRKIGNCNMYHDTIFQTFTNANSVKGIFTNSLTLEWNQQQLLGMSFSSSQGNLWSLTKRTADW